MTSTPMCGCHGEPLYWNRDPRRRHGGYWRCRVKQREQARANYNPDARRADKAAWYDGVASDILKRVPRREAENRRRRLRTLERMKATLTEGS